MRINISPKFGLMWLNQRESARESARESVRENTKEGRRERVYFTFAKAVTVDTLSNYFPEGGRTDGPTVSPE